MNNFGGGGVGSNKMKSAWQEWEGRESGRELAEHVESSGRSGGSVWI